MNRSDYADEPAAVAAYFGPAAVHERGHAPQTAPYAGMGGRGVAAAALTRRWLAEGVGWGARPGWRALHRGDTVTVAGEVWECLSVALTGEDPAECLPAGFRRVGYAWPRLTLEQAQDLHVRMLAAAADVAACGAPAAARALREVIEMHGPRPVPIPSLAELPYCPACMDSVVAGEEAIPAAAPCATVRVLADQLMVSPLGKREGARP